MGSRLLCPQTRNHFKPNSKTARLSARCLLVLFACFAFVAVLFPAELSAQSISVVQRATLNKQPSSGGTVTLTLPKATAAGHALVVGVSFWPRDISRVTDSSGDAFTRGLATSLYHNVSQGVMYTNFYYAKNTAGGATTVTLSFSGGSTYVVAAVSEVAGLDPSAPLVGSAYHESLSSTAPWSSAALATSTANEYLFAWAADEWNNPSCSNPTAGWTETQNRAGATLCVMDRTVSATGSYQVSVTPSYAFNYAMEIVGFKGASSASDASGGTAGAPAPLAITTTALPAGTVGAAYSANLAATGGVSPYTWSGSLPSGLSISASGTISGTPTAGGTQMASLTVKDSSGTTASSSLSLTVASGAVVVSISPTAATVPAGQSQSFAASVTGTTNTAVNWYVSGAQGGDAASGTISNGVYTAPACGGSSTVQIAAQSVYAPASQASASVTIASGTASTLARYVSTVGNDSNDGSACHPWATIQHAADSAQAGMTIHVAPGTYSTSAIITSSASGTASSRIRYLSDQQWGAKIVTSATQIWANTGAYVDIMGFDMSGTGGTYIGLHSQGNYDRAIGNRIHDMGSSGCPSGAGIMIGGGASNQSAIANIIYNVGPAPTANCNQIHGIYAQETGSVVLNNVTFNIAGRGLCIWGDRATNVTVVNNTSFHNQDGMVAGASGATSTVFDNSIIANNIFYGNVQYGIYESDSVGSNNRYLNNLVDGNPYGTGMLTGQLVGTVAANPQFVNYTGDASGDYHLTSGSPAIGAGTSTDAPSSDFSGGARPQGSRFDIGAYEYGALPAGWPWM